MSWEGAETIADAVVAYIGDTATQTAKLASVNARFTTTLTLPNFQAIRISDPDSENESAFPVLYIMPDNAELEYGAGHTSLAGRYRFEFAVLTWAAPTSDATAAEAVKRQSMRYILAVLEMLNDMHSHSVQTYWANGAPLHWGSDGQPPRLYYQPVYTNRTGEYLGDARLIIGLEHTEAA